MSEVPPSIRRPAPAPLGAASTADTGTHVKDPDAKPKITAIGGAAGAALSIEASWKRAPNKAGGGATHVRTFTAKMNASGLEHLDRHALTAYCRMIRKLRSHVRCVELKLSGEMVTPTYGSG